MSITEPRPSLDPNPPVFRGSGVETEATQPSQYELYTGISEDIEYISERLDKAKRGFLNLPDEVKQRAADIVSNINKPSLEGSSVDKKKAFLALRNDDRFLVADSIFHSIDTSKEILLRDLVEGLDERDPRKLFVDLVLMIPGQNIAENEMDRLSNTYGNKREDWPAEAQEAAKTYLLRFTVFNSYIRNIIQGSDGSFNREQLVGLLQAHGLEKAQSTVLGMTGEHAAYVAIQGMEGIERVDIADPADDAEGLDATITLNDGRRLFVDWKTGNAQQGGMSQPKGGKRLPSLGEGAPVVKIHVVDVDDLSFLADGFHLNPDGVRLLRHKIRKLLPEAN